MAELYVDLQADFDLVHWRLTPEGDGPRFGVDVPVFVFVV